MKHITKEINSPTIEEALEQIRPIVAEQQKAYYEQNKDKFKAYREQNKDKIAEQKKAYYEQNKDKIAEQQKAYYEQNKDKIAEQQKARKLMPLSEKRKLIEKKYSK